MRPPDELEKLLEPSLGGHALPAPLYSVRALFLTGFLGGPFAALAMWSLNAKRAGRLGADLPWLLLASVATLAVFALGLRFLMPAGGMSEPAGALSVSIRLFSLSLVGLSYWLHRERYRAMEIAGMESPNGLVPGLVCGSLGMGLQFLVFLAFLS